MVVAGRCERRRRRDKHPQAPFFCSHSIPSPLFSFFFNPKTPKHKPMFLYLQIEKKEHRYYLSLGFCFDLGLMVMLGRWSKHGLVIFTMVFDASAVVCSGVDGWKSDDVVPSLFDSGPIGFVDGLQLVRTWCWTRRRLTVWHLRSDGWFGFGLLLAVTYVIVSLDLIGASLGVWWGFLVLSFGWMLMFMRQCSSILCRKLIVRGIVSAQVVCCKKNCACCDVQVIESLCAMNFWELCVFWIVLDYDEFLCRFLV